MPQSAILTDIHSNEVKEKRLLSPSPSSSSLNDLMAVCSSHQEQKRDGTPTMYNSSSLLRYDESCSPSVYSESTYNDTDNDNTEASMYTDGCYNTHQHVKSVGVSIANLMHELQVNMELHGSISPQVASAYNAIGLFHCRLCKNYNEALHYHTEALRIINTLQDRFISHGGSEPNQHPPTTPLTATQIESQQQTHQHHHHHQILILQITTYMDIGSCYEFQQKYDLAIPYYEMCDEAIIRLERVIPKHITFACRRAIARIKR